MRSIEDKRLPSKVYVSLRLLWVPPWATTRQKSNSQILIQREREETIVKVCRYVQCMLKKLDFESQTKHLNNKRMDMQFKVGNWVTLQAKDMTPSSGANKFDRKQTGSFKYLIFWTMPTSPYHH